ncbi:tetratricopeptide repeat protein [Methylocapsa polymorpha]|uniref:Tetratricopeptide repeat protein n=1 Tax=Methylocapsa polymorpha TaxID=3080828 RepID=A0ABZ0HSN7_9HYPH|nr:tetratricopeptide repeat protein [Methylocapsa sp. RX1]
MSKAISRSGDGTGSNVRETAKQGGLSEGDLPADAAVFRQSTGVQDLPDAARMSDADHARREAVGPDGDEGTRQESAETAASYGLDDRAAGPNDQEALLAAAIEALERHAAARRHQAGEVLAAVNKLISPSGTSGGAKWETFAELSRKLDDLEARLRERSGVESGDAFTKNALQAVEAKLQIFTRRRTPAAVGMTDSPKAALTKSPAAAGAASSERRAAASAAPNPAPAQSAPSQGAGLGASEQTAFPFKSDLLSRLNASGLVGTEWSLAAPPADASAPIRGRNDIAELARKLDDMCRGVLHSPAHAGEAVGGGVKPGKDASPPSEDLGKAPTQGADAGDVNAHIESGRDAGQGAAVTDAFDRLARDAQGSTRDSDHSSTLETLKREIKTAPPNLESLDKPGADPSAFAHMQDQMAEIRDLVAAAAARPSPIDKIERQVKPLSKNLVGHGREDAPNESDNPGAATDEALAPLRPQARASVLDAIEARLDALTRTVDEAFTRSSDRGQFDALSQHIEATHKLFAARLEAGLTAASAETGTLKESVGSLVERMEAARDSKSTDLAIEALEREMAKVAERLNGADKAFASLTSLENSIGALFEQLEETRRTASEAVAAAKRSAARDLAPAASAGEPGSTSDLGPSGTGEIAELRAAREAADRRVDLTLTALRETVDKVAERLVKVEADIRAMHPARLGSLLAPNLTPIFAPRAERRPQDGDKIGAAAPTIAFAANALEPAEKPSAENGPGLDAKSIDAFDVLLEPGSGFPSRREKSEPPSAGILPAISYDLDGGARRADFIAAARRAAQTAQNGRLDPAHGLLNSESESGAGPSSGLLDRARRFFGARKRPVILSLAALLLAASAYALARTVVHTAETDDLSPTLLKQLGKGLVHGKAQQPPVDKAAARERGVAPAAPTQQPQVVPGLLDSSQLGPQQSLSTPQSGPAQPSADVPARRAIAGSAPIVIGALDRTGDLRQIVTAPAPAAPPPLAPKPLAPGEDPRERAEAGDAAAQFELGLRFAEGRDRPRDLKLAAQWYEKAALQGLAKAQYRLATLYERGLGAPRDMARAVNLYLAAAAQGNMRAMHNLGVIAAAESSDGRPDYATAALWFAKAAEFGIRDSQFNLAVLLARGLGVPQDVVKAYAWFAIVATQGDAEAAAKRDELGARLAAADLATAKMSAEAFRPRLASQAANEAPGPQGGSDAAESAGPASIGKPKVSGL